MAGSDLSGDELDLLADLDAGLLAGPERDRAEGLAATERGRLALAALARVRGDLAALPDPVVPPGLEARLLAAVVADASVGAAPGSTATRAPRPAREAVEERGPHRRTASRRRAWAAGAVAAGVLVGAAVTTGVLRSGADGDAGFTAAGGAESVSSAEPAPQLGADSAEAAGRTALAEPPPVAAVASGRDYTPGDLRAAALALATGRLSAPASGPDGHPPPAAAPAELARLREPAELRACVQALAGGPAEPLVVDLALVDGAPAVIAVVPGPDGEPVVHAAGPRCSADDADRLPVSPG